MKELQPLLPLLGLDKHYRAARAFGRVAVEACPVLVGQRSIERVGQQGFHILHSGSGAGSIEMECDPDISNHLFLITLREAALVPHDPC